MKKILLIINMMYLASIFIVTAQDKKESSSKSKKVLIEEGIIAPPINTNHDFFDKNQKYILDKKKSTRDSYVTFYGIKDLSGKTILPTVYTTLKNEDDFIIASFASTYGVFDKNFQLVLPFEFSYLQKIKNKDQFITSCRLCNSSSGREGIIDSKGNIILPFIYTDIKTYYTGAYNYFTRTKDVSKFLGVSIENEARKYAFYNSETNEFATNFKFKFIESKENGFIVTLLNLQQQVLNLDLKPVSNESFNYIQSFERNNSVIVTKNGKKGIIDFNGKWIIPLKYDDIIATGVADKLEFILANDKGFRLVNDKGQALLNNKIFSALKLSGYSNFLFAKENDKIGVISPSGTTLLPFQFDSVFFKYPYFFCRRNNGYQIHDIKGSMITTFEGGDVEVIYNRYIVTNIKKGILSDKFEVVVPFVYDRILFTKIGGKFCYVVAKNGKWGILSEENKIILPLDYQLIGHIGDDRILFKMNNKYGLLDSKDFKVIVPCDYDLIVPDNYNRNKYIFLKDQKITYSD